MSAREVNCPNCGAPLQLESRFTTIVVCQYCGTTSYVRDEGLDPTGKMAKLVDYASRLKVGREGTIRGRGFRTLGRVRYQYEDGTWDEWYLQFDDGQPAWLSEDEGEYVLLFKKRLTSPLPPWDAIRVGGFLPVDNDRVFVSEKGTGRVAGAEGELSMVAAPGRAFQYVDGNASGKAVGIVFTENAINFSQGEPLEFQDIQVKPDQEQDPYR